MKKILTLVMVLGTASMVYAAQTGGLATTDSVVTVGAKLYSLQEAAAYFNNSFWVRTFSKLNSMVPRNTEHSQKLCDMHQAIMPVTITVTNKSDTPRYLPVNNWVTGFDAAYNTASIAAAYGQPWTGFAVSGLLMLAGAGLMKSSVAYHDEYRNVDHELDRVRVTPAGYRFDEPVDATIGATFLALGGYMAYKLWKAQSTSTTLRTLQPRIVRTVNGKRVETQVAVKTVRDMSFYELPAGSAFETMLFVPRTSTDVKVVVTALKEATLPKA